MLSNLSVANRRQLIRIIIAILLFVPLLITDLSVDLDTLTPLSWVLPVALYFLIYLIIGYDILYKAARNIIRLNPLDENFLMCLATLGAFGLAVYNGVNGAEIEGAYEGCAVIILYQVGELFQSVATDKSRRSITELMDICPDTATVIRQGEALSVYPEEVTVGETVLVKAGEKIPLDGILTKGTATLDTRALTGEAEPREYAVGESVLSGCVNLISPIEIRVEKELSDSTVSKILDLVENAADKKSRAEAFISKFARWYTPVVVFLALCLAIIPTVIYGGGEWIYRSLSFLVVSCPCAIVISVPMAFFAGIGAMSRKQILVKGSDYIEALNLADTFVFDKTGTVTTGEFKVISVLPEENRERVLGLASVAEADSIHPIARSVISAYTGATDKGYVTENKAGYGVVARKDDDVILCGSYKLMELYGIECEKQDDGYTSIYVAQKNRYVGVILVSDEIKEGVKDAVSTLENNGAKCIMLTGDKPEIAKKVAQSVGISEYKASLLPEDKVLYVEKLINEKKKGGGVCFIGDGINDAPVLMRSDVGVSMGALGSDAAIEASDIVLIRDDVSSLPVAKGIARRTVRIAKQNIAFPLIIKVAILVLSALGLANMWLAVFGDVGVAVLAILNSMRISRIK